MAADPARGPARTSDLPRSLLERLRADDLQMPARKSDPLAERIASIKANLVQVLNGRAGGAASAPEFGLSDLNDSVMGSRDLLAAITRDIARTLLAHEPRVSDVVVRFDRSQNGGTELFFVVQATTRITHRTQQLTIDLVMKEGRRFAAT